jgi:propionyl-CoA carboxylase alpha chain/3-methylcrotonyl-CoA carboxylase alpha subunit/acetyl-CoA/propionyl-CoA carboxylase biotin carboxyl carrier protein
MNTRLQVEHPVSEAITGLDFVEMQLAVADGAALPDQNDIGFTGHAVEFRVCAERPERDFLPATGHLRLLRVPDRPGLRWDGGPEAGQAVTASFDPMMAKLIAHGADRAQALERGARALEELVLLGVDTNIDYLARIARHPAFAAGELHTGFVEEHADQLRRSPLAAEEKTALLAAAAQSDRVATPLDVMGGWRN